MDDLDDLMGPAPKPAARRKTAAKPAAKPQPAKRPRGRPTKAQAAAHAEQMAAKMAEAEPDPAVEGLARGAVPDAAEFHRPVTRTFLATVLQIEPRRMVKKLARCPVIGYTNYRGDKTPLYDFKEAIAHCVEPKIDIGQWLKTQNAMSLPPHLNKAFWDAMRSRQMVEERAKDLWKTEDVLEVLGRTALTIKETCKLWVENLPGKASLSTEQYDGLGRAVDDLLADIHQRLVGEVKERHTRSSLGDLETMMLDVGTSDLGDDE